MMMFLGMISSAMSGVSFWRRMRLRKRDGHSALGRVLADDILIQLRDDLTRSKVVECELLFFGGRG